MFFLFDVASHDAYGPFMSRREAHAFASDRCIGPCQVFTDGQAQQTLQDCPILTETVRAWRETALPA